MSTHDIRIYDTTPAKLPDDIPFDISENSEKLLDTKKFKEILLAAAGVGFAAAAGYVAKELLTSKSVTK